jgi:hypothetical protein
MHNSTAIGCRPRYTRRDIQATVNSTTAQLTSAFVMGDGSEDISYAGSDGTGRLAVTYCTTGFREAI